MDVQPPNDLPPSMPTIAERNSIVSRDDFTTGNPGLTTEGQTDQNYEYDGSDPNEVFKFNARAKTWQGGRGSGPKPLQRSKTARIQRSKQIATGFKFTRKTKSTGSVFSPAKPTRQSTADTYASLSFEKTAIWDRKAVLSLDGGGIRGYSALLIIRALMEAIGRIEKQWPEEPDTSGGPAKSSYHPLPAVVSAATDSKSLPNHAEDDQIITATSPWLPCHYFDYMAGTSTGGLISIMLGRLRMNIDDCIQDYKILGAKVFGKPRRCHFRSPLWWPRDKYNHKILREVVEEVVRQRVPKVADFPGGQNFAFDENRCRVVVVAYQENSINDVGGNPYLFRTYKNLHRSKDPEEREAHRNRPAMAHDIPIWQVARATSAAPTYFKPPKINDRHYLDGGFGSNNPCVEILNEVHTMNNNAPESAKLIISIGTGKSKSISRFSSGRLAIWRFWNYINFAAKWASESETRHIDMINAQKHNPDSMRYHRLNVEEGLDEMKLDEWRERGKVKLMLGRCIAKTRARLRKFASGNKTKGKFVEEKSNDQDVDSDSSTIPSGSLAVPYNDIPDWLRPRNKTIEAITRHTENYLGQAKVRNHIEECAQLLVQGRRERAKNDPDRWEKACRGTWYQCTVRMCPRGEKEYLSRDDLRRHLLHKHSDLYRTDSEEAELKLKKALDDEFKIIVH